MRKINAHSFVLSSSRYSSVFFSAGLPLLINCYGRITLFKIHRKGFGYIFVPEKRCNMKKLSKEALIGYPAGIITGITYGLNPLFAVPLMNKGAAIESILFFRYAFAEVILGAFLWLTKQSFKITAKQAGVLLVLGLLYTSSSICLFEAYNYIASGLATTKIKSHLADLEKYRRIAR